MHQMHVYRQHAPRLSVGINTNKVSEKMQGSQRPGLFHAGFKLAILGLQMHQQRHRSCGQTFPPPPPYHQLQPNA